MATEYRLSYTAEEIDEKLGKIDDLALAEEVYIGNSEPTKAQTVWIDTSGNNANVQSPLKKLKCGVLGDSITYGAFVNHETESYPALLKADFKEVINYGISSTLIAKNDNYPNAMCERYVNMADDLDVIIVMGGTNDFAVGSSVADSFGEPNSTDIYTFYGALNALMSGLVEKYIGKEIFFCTPIHISYDGYNSDTVKPNGKTLKDYRNAIIERCAYYSIPCIDTFAMSGMDIAHNTTVKNHFTTDGCHPNAKGHIRLHDRIFHEIKNRIGEYENQSAVVLKYKDDGSWRLIGDSAGKASDYIFYNYLQGSGTSYINTDVCANQNTRFELKCKASTEADAGLLAVYGSNNKYFGVNTWSTSATKKLYWSWNGQYTSNINFVSDTDYVLSNNGSALIVNGNTELDYQDNGVFDLDKPLYLFAVNNKGVAQQIANSDTRIYECKIWNDSTLIRNFVPAKRIEDNAIGMYDKVSKTFYQNSGSGTFGVGEEIV